MPVVQYQGEGPNARGQLSAAFLSGGGHIQLCYTTGKVFAGVLSAYRVQGLPHT
jgi:hypothetical protein